MKNGEGGRQTNLQGQAGATLGVDCRHEEHAGCADRKDARLKEIRSQAGRKTRKHTAFQAMVVDIDRQVTLN